MSHITVPDGMDGTGPLKTKSKFRCPKCTAVLKGPQNDIHICPICSARLLAKDIDAESSDNTGLKLRENSSIRSGVGLEGMQSRIAMLRFNEAYSKDFTQFNKSSEASRSEEDSHMLATEDLSQKINTLSIEVSQYSLNGRNISKSLGSSFRDEEGDRFSELSSASDHESEFEEGDNIDKGKAIKNMHVNNLVSSSQSTSMNSATSLVTSKQSTIKSFESSKEDLKGVAGNAAEKGYTKSPGRKLFDLRVFGIFDEKAYEGLNSVKQARLPTSEMTEHQRTSMDDIKDSITEETSNSSLSMQDVNSPQQDGNEKGNIVREKELDGSFLGNAKVESTAPAFSSLNAIARIDTDALVEARYGNVSVKDLSPEAISYVDVSFGDWKASDEVPEIRTTVDEKNMLTPEVNEEADEWDENESTSTLKNDLTGNSLSFVGQGEQNDRSLTGRDGVLPERSVLPFRTAAMQKFLLQRTEQENVAQAKASQEANIYEAPYDFNYVPRQTAKPNEPIDEKASMLAANAHINEPLHENRRDKRLGTQIQKQSSTEMSLSVQSNVKDPVVFEIAQAEERFDSEGGKDRDRHIDKMDQSEIERMNSEQQKVVNTVLHSMPSTGSQSNRGSPLVWKGKSKTESHNSEGLGLDLVPSQAMGKYVTVAHGTEVDEDHSHFDKEGKPGSGQLPRRWNRPFDGGVGSFQAEEEVRGDPRFPIVDSFNKNSRSASPQEVEIHSHSVEQYHKKPYSVRAGSNLPHRLPQSSFNTMSSMPLHEQTFDHSMSPFYNQPKYYHVEQPQRYQNMILHKGDGHQSLHHQEHDLVSELSTSSSYRESRNPPPRSRRRNRSKLHQKYMATKEKNRKLYPPFPDKMAAPYVLCKYCNEILEIPSYLPPSMGPIQKVQCGACKRLCKFSTSLQGADSGRMDPSSLPNDGSAMHGYDQGEQFVDSESERSFRQRSLSEQNSLHYFSRNASSQQKGLQNYVRSKPNDRKDVKLNIVDHVYHPRDMAKTKRGNSRIYSDGYLSSSPSSASGSSPGKYHMAPGDFGENNHPQTLIVGPKRYEQDQQDAEATFSTADFYFRNSGTNRSTGSYNTVTQDRTGLSRNSSRNVNNAQFSPGSPRVVGIPEDEITSLYQDHMPQDSLPNGPRSPPWSPAAQGFPLQEHLTQDNDREWQPQSPQGASKETKSYARFLKRSLMDFGKGHRVTNRGKGVTINGNLVSDAALRKAEEKSGTVHPGAYWYDYRAGFWGVIGNPCQGIIMPYIEEFNFPMEKGCSGGNTGILVNGRELHQKDLDILAKRGLPTLRGRAYIIDIQGNITDLASGQRLQSLGKLAPTIEKKGRGWGMFQPIGKAPQQC